MLLCVVALKTQLTCIWLMRNRHSIRPIQLFLNKFNFKLTVWKPILTDKQRKLAAPTRVSWKPNQQLLTQHAFTVGLELIKQSQRNTRLHMWQAKIGKKVSPFRQLNILWGSENRKKSKLLPSEIESDALEVHYINTSEIPQSQHNKSTNNTELIAEKCGN